MKRSTGTPVNLLPLLDVLLCTMGTLIVVLGVLSRMARNHSVAHEREELAIAKEQVTLRIDQLTTAREKTIADLNDARRRLSGIEDHSRQLADKLKALSAAASQLSGDNAADDKRDSLRRELNQLNTERAQLDKDLETARNSIGQHKVRFSIVPFDGVYKTNRRPIYIECRGDSIVLQPEGIVLTPNDFLGPSGPGNPLASALRAAQEYWSQSPPPGADVSNDPYPLLLVRPNGIIAYYLARDAMASWNAEFGYELITADARLEFPAAPEARLVEMERRAVDEARQRLQWLAQVSPESFQRKKNVQYRVSAIRGGLVRDGAPSLGNDPFANDPLGGFGKSPGGNSTGRGPGDSGPGINGPGGGGPDGGGYPQEYRMADTRGNAALGFGGNGGGAGDGFGAGNNGDAGGRFGSTGLGPGRDGIGAGGRGNSLAAESGSHVFGNGGAPGEAPGAPGTGTTAAAGAAGSPNNGFATSGNDQSLVGPRYAGAGTGANSPESGPMMDAQGMSNTRGGSARSGTSLNSCGSTPGESGSEGSAGGDSSTAGGTSSTNGAASAASSSMGQSGAGSSSDPSQMSGIPSPSLNFNANQQRTARKLANERGRNWALQTNTNASVPITRPIRIECWNDRLVLTPDGFDQQPQVIPLADRTDEAVDQLVAAVRVHTQGWGLAGRSMYWKPQLVLDVKPSAESRAADLQSLLADSGLDVKRK